MNKVFSKIILRDIKDKLASGKIREVLMDLKILAQNDERLTNYLIVLASRLNTINSSSVRHIVDYGVLEIDKNKLINDILSLIYEFETDFHELLIDEFIERTLNLKFVTFSNALQENLESEKEKCKKFNIYFYTPNLFCALLKDKNGVVSMLFNTYREGLAERLRFLFNDYIENELINKRRGAEFSEFKWIDRLDVKKAYMLANAENTDVADIHLLKGIFYTNSKTVKMLKEKMDLDLSYFVGAQENRINPNITPDF